MSVSPSASILLIIAAVAFVSDLRWNIIPNSCTYGGLLLGLVLGLAEGGTPELSQRGLGSLAGFLATYPFFHAGVMGGGDVKLIAAFGALNGPESLLIISCWGLSIGLVGVVVTRLTNGEFLILLRHLSASIIRFVHPGHKIGPHEPPVSEDQFPLGAMLAVGVFGHLLYQASEGML
ncbi:MAG: A24 family peptidase [Myxococcales bacterium]|nr:A24 family peptidase [Myxococcales bacterium]